MLLYSASELVESLTAKLVAEQLAHSSFHTVTLNFNDWLAEARESGILFAAV